MAGIIELSHSRSVAKPALRFGTPIDFLSVPVYSRHVVTMPYGK
jgi:hypothetical protein